MILAVKYSIGIWRIVANGYRPSMSGFWRKFNSYTNYMETYVELLFDFILNPYQDDKIEKKCLF